MDTISLYDGLILTVVSMLVVFLVLAAIWGLMEIISKVVSAPETPTEPSAHSQPADHSIQTKTLKENPEYKQVAELIALILASEDQPDRKFEIIESKRVK